MFNACDHTNNALEIPQASKIQAQEPQSQLPRPYLCVREEFFKFRRQRPQSDGTAKVFEAAQTASACTLLRGRQVWVGHLFQPFDSPINCLNIVASTGTCGSWRACLPTTIICPRLKIILKAEARGNFPHVVFVSLRGFLPNPRISGHTSKAHTRTHTFLRTRTLS